MWYSPEANESQISPAPPDTTTPISYLLTPNDPKAHTTTRKDIVTMKVYKYGDNVDTDVIIPARYLNAPDEKSLASHCMEDIDASFASTVEEGDIIVAGANFGCGSSREHAPLAIKASGVKCVIAPSFARIFYRNAINIGFPILECAEAAEGIQAGDTVSVDFNTGVITDETTGKTYQAAPLPEFVQGIVDNGGLLKSLKARGVAK